MTRPRCPACGPTEVEIPTSIVLSEDGMLQREVLHPSEAACKGCHRLTPIGDPDSVYVGDWTPARMPAVRQRILND